MTESTPSDPIAFYLPADWEDRARLVSSIQAVLSGAAMAAVPTVELIARVSRLWEDPNPHGVQTALLGLELSDSEREQLGLALETLLQDVERQPSRDRGLVDRHARHLVVCVPPAIGQRIAATALAHRRRSRRTIAYRWLRQQESRAEWAKQLLDTFEETGDQAALKAIVTDPTAVRQCDITALLEALEERYWRARVFEALLQSEDDRAMEHAETYPAEFVWAVGRLRSSAHREMLDRLFVVHKQEPGYAGLYLWAVGQLGDRTAQRRIAEELKNLYASDFMNT